MLIRNWKDCATLEARSIRYPHVRALAHTHTHTAIVLRSNKTCEIVHPRDLCVRIRWNNFISVGHARHEWNARVVQSQTRTWRKVQFCIVFAFLPVPTSGFFETVASRFPGRKERFRFTRDQWNFSFLFHGVIIILCLWTTVSKIDVYLFFFFFFLWKIDNCETIIIFWWTFLLILIMQRYLIHFY